MFNYTTQTQWKNYKVRILGQELPLLMMISQVKSVLKRVNKLKFLLVKNLLKLLLLERMGLMVKLRLIIEQLN